jgi:Ca-activated chloride channel family protein
MLRAIGAGFAIRIFYAGSARVRACRLSGLLLALTAVALAGPSWQRLPDSAFTSRDARVLVLDLSLSMLAEDLRPNRLTRARYRLTDILDATEEGQTGLVAYAGHSFVVSPLTSDVNTIGNMLPALRPDIIPVAGSRADHGLVLAASLLRRAAAGRGEILLISDSATPRDAAAARGLRDEGIVTSVLAVGTAEGAPIPSGGGFVTDNNGNVVIARVDRSALAAVADAGGGRYSELGPSSGVALPWLASEGREFARSDDALGERWKDAGPWLVLLLLPFVAVGFRRGMLFALPLFCLPGLAMSPPAHADTWSDLWQTRDRQAWEALQAEDAQRAASLAENPALSGEAWFRSGEYPRAVESWSGLPGAEAHYNRGNALAHLGEFEGAIAAYDSALELAPDHEDALFNRDLVEQMRRQQEQQQQEQQQGESENSESSEGEQGEQEEQQQSEQTESSSEESSEPESDQQQGEPSQEEMDAIWSEEDAQAMEQWLRRIPDDPGGLLRRKFRNQHQRMGAPADEADHW